MREFLVLIWIAGAIAAPPAEASPLQPFSIDGAVPTAPWHVVGLPRQTKPFTQFSIVDLDGHRALRVQADESYGNLVHPLDGAGNTGHLVWQWRVEQLNDAVDLRTQAGDDTALKVCASFDQPIQDMPFLDRQWLRIARSQSSEPLPGATICYVWDPHLPVGTTLPSPFTRRLRYLVLESGDQHVAQWLPERRDLAADFHRLFGAESAQVPAIVEVEVGADADNTHGHSLGYVTGLALQP